MKIFGNREQGGLGYIRPIFLCEHPEINSPLRMVVDTGASHTTISERDAIRFGIDYEQLTCPPNNKVLGVGGTCDFYTLDDTVLMFKKSINSWHIERLDKIYILKNEFRNEEERINALRVPSLLGMDILNKCKIYYTHKRVYIEI